MHLRLPLAALAVLSLVARGGAATAQTPPQPLPSAQPTALPRALGVHVQSDFSLTGIDQSTTGPGQIAPEAPGFRAGAPLAPNTPYDLFSSAPDVPGIAGIAQAIARATYGFRNFDAAVTAGAADVDGSITNAAYWGESLLPTLNPHLGAQALPYTIAFPTHAGQDDGRTFRASLLAGELATADGALRVRGGYFDLVQSDRFVFAQAPLTNVSPAIAFAPAESLTNGLAALDGWTPQATQLPLHGIDAVAHRGDATVELTSAALPSLPGEAARVTLGSLAFDRGEGTRFSAGLVHLTTSGLPFLTTVPFGANPAYVATAQGVLPIGTLDGQRQTIAGVHAAFHLSPGAHVDAVVDVGRAWYDATNVALPGSSRPGGYYHAGVTQRHGRSTASLDVYRMEPRYATIILPYGAPENQWSAAFAWPGQWLKSDYQTIDNTVLGVNRQGYRFRYFLDGGPLEMHAEYTDLRQIAPETTITAEETGFVDGFYLPQLPNAATFGRQKRYAIWAAWHPAIGDLTLDVVDDTLFRGTAAGAPLDGVSCDVPQAVLSFTRHLSPAVVASVGLGRFAMNGRFAEPIDFAERVFLAGGEVRQNAHASLLVSVRRSAFAGTTGGAFTGTLVEFEERYHL